MDDDEQIDKRLEFLASAAEKYINCPDIMCNFGLNMLEVSLMAGKKIQQATVRRFCGHCGSIFLVGYNCSMYMSSVKERTRRRDDCVYKDEEFKASKGSFKTKLIYDCFVCKKSTIRSGYPKVTVKKEVKKKLPLKSSKETTNSRLKGMLKKSTKQSKAPLSLENFLKSL